MDKLRNAIKDKTDRSLDRMVKATNSLFTTAVLECPVPLKFQLPQLEPFNGFKDPQDHLKTFKMTLGFQQPPDEILCYSFPTILKGATREWFTKLPTSSIDTFEQLSNAFLHHFVGGQRSKRPADHLLTIKQGEKETLRSYVKRFTWETLEVDEADDKVQLTTFKVGLKSREFVVSLAKNPPKTMAKMLLKLQKYMNAEKALCNTPILILWLSMYLVNFNIELMNYMCVHNKMGVDNFVVLQISEKIKILVHTI